MSEGKNRITESKYTYKIPDGGYVTWCRVFHNGEVADGQKMFSIHLSREMFFKLLYVDKETADNVTEAVRKTIAEKLREVPDV